MGAWIETDGDYLGAFGGKSHPMWVRGLKLLGNNTIKGGLIVASYVGAWIETLIPW